MLKKNKITIGVGTALFGMILYTLFAGHSHDHHDHDHDHDHHHHEDEEKTTFIEFDRDKIANHNLQIEEASPGSLEQMIKATGKITINSNELAHIIPKVTGIAVTAHKNIGEKVYQGEVLALLESREMAETKADYLAALKREKLTNALFRSEEGLYAHKISSKKEYEQTKADADHAQIDLELSRQKLYALGLSKNEIESLPHTDPSQLRVYELRAPFNGTIISKHMTPGELIQADHEAYVLANLSDVWAELILYPQDLAFISNRQSIKVIGPHGLSDSAELIYLSPVIDEEVRGAKAIAQLDNRQGKWYPGTFITAEILTESHAVPLLVPKSAVHRVDDQNVVFVYLGEGFDARPIELGESDDRSVQVLSGLQAGEKIATNNSFILKADLKKDEAEHEH